LVSGDEAAIRRIIADLGARIGAHDFVTAADCFADDAVLMLPGSRAIEGRPAIGAALAAAFGGGAPQVAVTVAKIDVAESGELAYARGTGVTHGPNALHSKWVAVFRKNPTGDWRIAADIFNDGPPA
jgi:ketosteroid isomerase-like protein